MTVVIPTLCCFALYVVGFRFYARFLGTKIFALRPEVLTPAHVYKDGVDYLPTRKSILFGHHFASITGLAPMLGPAVAVIWGWVPAMAWVVFGAILIGCVHDFSALVLSLRGRGMSIGKVAEGIIGPRAKILFLLVILFGVGLAMGVFVFVIGKLFAVEISANVPGYPGAVTPSAGLMLLALAMGFLLYKKGVALAPLALVAFIISLLLVYVGYLNPTMGLNPQTWPQASTWIWVLLTYAFIASVLPVWVLLQARDFVNSMLLYLGLGAAYIGLFVYAPTFQAPAFRLEVEGAPGILPFVFIVIACGAASGFHGLVSSGTTAKQLDNEGDAVVIGYGGMVAESLLALLAVLATTAGMGSEEMWFSHYHDWASAQNLAGKISAFINGTARFISALGVEKDFAAAFVAVVVVSFALTTLDSATRLLRYNIEELAESFGFKVFRNRYISSVAGVLVIALFAFYEVDGKPAALALWTLFGTTNQLLAGLTLLVVTVYLKHRQRPLWFTGIPAIFMLGTTLIAMTQNIIKFMQGDPIQWLLLIVGASLWLLGVWIVAEGIWVLRKEKTESSLDITYLGDQKA
jgi:carbon starvation protein